MAAAPEDNTTGYCHCLSGYWGPACQNTCPGGTSNPCHGNGLCDPETGQCTCFTGVQQDSNCSRCEEGWFGTDCSVAMMDSPASSSSSRYKYKASSYGSGHLHTFDGSLYNYQRVGEHVLMDTALPVSGNQLKIHGKFVISANTGAVLCQAAAVAVGSEVLELHALASGVVLAHNGVRLSRLELPSSLAPGVEVRLVRHGHIVVESGEAVVVDIYLHEVSVDISVTASFEVCNVSQALFSSCSGVLSPTNDFVLRDGTVLSDQVEPFLNQRSIHDTFGPSWLVQPADSLFQLISIINPVSGYGLKFSHSHAVSEHLHIFAAHDAALEITFRLDTGLSESCQTLWSYRRESAPDVTVGVCRNTVAVYLGAEEKTTSLTVQAALWYHLVVSWSAQGGQLNLILLRDRLTVSNAILNIDTSTSSDLFVNGGQLVIGKRNILTTEIDGYSWNLKGVIDDVKIWKRFVGVTEVRQRFGAYYLTDTDLTCHWNLEEGHGSVSLDRVASIRLTFPVNPWWHPAWIDVDFPYVLPTLDEYNIYSYLRTYSRSPYSAFCVDHVYSAVMNSSCSYLGTAAVFSFYQQCVMNSDTFHTASASMEVVITLASVCQYYSQHTSLPWPAQSFCHDFPGRYFSKWAGSDCSEQCFFGDWDKASSACDCDDGFYGDTCESVCPLSSGLVCGGGVCDNTGACSCSLNLHRTSSCDGCAADWTGTDCSVAIVTDTEWTVDSRVCMLYGFSHIVMFDGQAFDFDTTGEFVLLEMQTVSFYSQIHPCPGNKATCMQSLWIRTASSNLTITQSVSSGGILLWQDGVEAVENSIHVPDVNLTVTQFSPTTVDITAGSHLTVNVVLQDYLLTASFTSRTTDCSSSSGLCGNCDSNLDNDFVTDSGVVAAADVSVAIINTAVAQHWSLADWPSTGFIYTQGSQPQMRHPSSDGFSVRFNSSAAYTGNIDAINGSSDISFEVKIQPEQTASGTVLVYTATSELSIAINDSVLVVIVDGEQFVTSVHVSVGVVHHLAVVVQQSQHTISLYLFTHGSSLQSYTVLLSHSLTLAAGRLNIGGNDVTGIYFVGIIDEVRVWLRALTVYQVLQTSSVRVEHGFSALLAVWSLNEGRGQLAVDTISHLELYLPSSGTSWVLSPYTWPEDQITWYYSRHTQVPELSGTSCDRIRTDTTIINACGSLGTAAQSFAYRACVGDLGAATTEDVYVYDTSAYVLYCMKLLVQSNPPTNTVCQDRDDPLYHQLCTSACKFGVVNDDDGICHCNSGYWGLDCSNVCPGGTLNPCHGRGFCDKATGACQCQPTWSEDMDCSTCKEGWSGSECSMFIPPSEDNVTDSTPTMFKYCSMFGLSHAVSLNNATFSIRAAGEFHVLTHAESSIDIQARQTFCEEATLCTTAVGVKVGVETVVLRAGFTSDDLAQVWVNGNLVTSPNPADISSGLTSLVVRWESTHEYVISDSQQKLWVKLRTDQRRVTMTMRVNSTLCPDADTCGLCGYNQTDSSTPHYTAWNVSHTDSLFSVLFVNSAYGETEVISPAAHSLLMQGDGIASEILPDVFPLGEDLSVALLVKPDTAAGVVLSYGRFGLFGLVYDSSLKISINGTAYDTGLSLVVREWNELIVVYTAALFRFDVYIHNSANILTTNFVVVSSDFVFEVSGVLTVGGWTEVVGAGSGSFPLISGFTGQVDELRVWHQVVTYSDISIAWQSQRLFSAVSVFVHWTFNEGQGTVIVDRVRKYTFSFYGYDWTLSVPLWRLSDYVFHPPVIPSAHVFTDVELLRSAESKCTSALYSTALTSQCGGTHQAFVQFYYAMCLSDTAAMRSSSMALTCVLSITDLCEVTWDLTTWPGQSLCHLFDTYPRFGGDACSVECLFGSAVSSSEGLTGVSQCQCHTGFWGSSCQSTCPGGVANTCRGHGECVSHSGNCVCHAGWAGTECSHCAEGWHGSDCAVTVQTNGVGGRFCSLTANSHLVTLDGAGVTFSQSGIFSFYASSSLRVEVMSQSCHRFGSCVVQAAMEVMGSGGGAETLLVSALNTTHVVVNQVAQVLSPTLSLAHGFKLVALDKYNLQLEGGSDFKMSIAIRESYLDFHVSLSLSQCSADGLCGPCDPGPTSQCNSGNQTCFIAAQGIAAFLTSNPAVSSASVQTYLSLWKRSYASSIFSRAAVPSAVSNPTSVAVVLTGGYLVTSPIPASVLRSDHLTVSLSVRISSVTNLTSSVVWSYAETHVLAVLIQDGHLALYFQGQVVATELRVHVDVWSDVALVYSRNTGVAVLHYLWYSQSQVKHLYQVVRIGVGVLPAGGTLAVGTWQVSVVTSPRPQVRTYCVCLCVCVCVQVRVCLKTLTTERLRVNRSLSTRSEQYEIQILKFESYVYKGRFLKFIISLSRHKLTPSCMLK